MSTKPLPEIPGWEVKLIQREKRPRYWLRLPRLELRQRIRECDVLLTVQKEGGWTDPTSSWTLHSHHDCRVKLSLNGSLWLEPGDLVNIDNAARVALGWFEGSGT